MSQRTCSVPGCDARHEAHGYCVKHYRRLQTHQDVHKVLIDWDADRRFQSQHVKMLSGCWEWQGKDRTRPGYVRWFVNGSHVLVHRWAYERFVGPIPDGLVIDHLCRNPPCVNPAHLEPVTQAVNTARAATSASTINAAKTHCLRGHPLSGANLSIGNNNGRPARQCRTCHAQRQREYLRRKRASNTD